MPSSGQLLGNAISDPNPNRVYLNWAVFSQDVATNKTTLFWSAGWRFSEPGSPSCRGLRLGDATINGTVVYDDNDGGDGVHAFVSGHNHADLETAWGFIDIPHNVDGTKTFSAFVGMTAWSGGGPNFRSEASGSWSLPTIPQLSSAPSTPVLSSITSSSMIATFTDAGDGAPVTARQLAYGTTTDVNAATVISSDGSDTISGLASGTTYYVWARTENVAGYSPWSGRASATTLGVPQAPSQPVLSNVTQISMTITWSPNGNGGSAITNYDIAYHTSNDVNTATVLSNVGLGASPYNLTGLDPGVTYYVWVRAKNAVGNSAWSLVAISTSIAGVRVKYGGVWKLAIPYVRVSGVWVLARPWAKSFGVWKETV